MKEVSNEFNARIFDLRETTETEPPQTLEAPSVQEAEIEDPKRRKYGLIGAALMAIGTFMPILHLPVVGSINYLHNGRGDGMIVLVLAGLSYLFIRYKKFGALILTGGASLGIMFYALARMIQQLEKTKAELTASDNMFKGLGEAMLTGVQIEWGWAPLLAGAGLLVVAGFWKGFKVTRTQWILLSIIGALLLIIALIFVGTVFQVEGLSGFIS